MNVQEGTGTSTAVSTVARENRRRVLTALVIFFLAAGFVATFTVTASGQQYEQIKLPAAYQQPANVKKMKDAAKRISVTRDMKNFAQRNVAEAFFKTYVPAKITHPDAVGEITPLISEVMLRLSAAQRSDAPFTPTLMEWIYRGLKPVALGNYQPAARIAAISALSRIDEAPPDLRQGTPPKPLRFILTDFLPIYEDEKNEDGVRAAALQGIHRYVMYAAPSIKGASLTKIKSLMNDLLTQEPPQGRSAKAHAYLQRFAVDILSILRGKSDPALGQQLISISTEVEKPDLIALHSAARIGEMATDLQGKVDAPDEVLAKWAVRAMRSFQYEAIRLKALDRPKAVSPQPPKPDGIVRPATEKPSASTSGAVDSGMESYGSSSMEGYDEDSSSGMDDSYAMEMMMGGRSMMTAKARPQPPEVFVSRRKLNHVLQQLHLGATGSVESGMPSQAGGLLAGVADDKKAVVEGWVTSMDEVLTALNDETLDDRKKYIAALEMQAEMLRDIAGPAAEEAEAMAPLEIPNVAPVVAAAEAAGEEKAAATVGVAGDQPVRDKAGIPQLPVEDELSFD